MSPGQDPLERRFAAARQLPPALDRQEVALLFLHPTPPPPAPPWYAGRSKFFTMLLSVIAVSLALLLGLPPATPTLSSFPIAATAAETTPPPPPNTNEDNVWPADNTATQTTDTRPSGKAKALPQLTAAPTSPAPAAAPTTTPALTKAPAASSTPPATNLPTTPADQANKPGQRTGELPPTVFSGAWSLRQQTLRVVISEVSNTPEGQKYYLPVVLTGLELELLKEKSAPANKIERAAGTLILRGGKKKGTFEFVPNPTYRQQLNDAGFGDEGFSENDAASSAPTINSLTISPAALPKADYPLDMLWFKYFISNVDEDYFQVLLDYGYTKEDLQDFNYLPYYTVSRSLLIETLEKTDKLFSERVPLKDLAPLAWRLPYLNTLLFQGLKDLSLIDFRQREESNPLKSMMLQGYGQDSLQRFLIGTRNQDSLPFLSDSLMGLFNLKEISRSIPEDWGLNVPGREAFTFDTKDFNRLALKGKIRLFANYSEDGPQQLIVYCQPAVKNNIKLKQRGAKLKLSKLGEQQWIDVEITGPKMKSITSKGWLTVFHPKKE